MMLRLAALLVIAAVSASCGSPQLGGGGARGNKKGTVILYKDAADRCQIKTTPYFKIKKNAGKAEWKVDDDFDCITGSLKVRISFDKGEGNPCEADPEGTNNLTCTFRSNAEAKKYGYTVFFDTVKEDPELQIEM